MRIVLDKNVLGGEEAFASLGEVVPMTAEFITRDALQGADALFIRSATKINEQLLDGLNLQFIGTATAGEDHIDHAYLKQRGIAYSAAPGCNAVSVAEYVVAALLELANERGFRLSEKRLGIVGVGNVGNRVAAYASALGMELVLCDPPLAERTGDPKYQPYEAALRCDVLTYHVPLTKSGSHATHHMGNAQTFDAMRTGSIIINAARGPVVDNAALRIALEEGKVGACVLDVWEGEPEIDCALLANCAIATPHIAGHSVEGKVNGTKQVYDAFCGYLGVEQAWIPDMAAFSGIAQREHRVDAADTIEAALLPATRIAYDILADDKNFREIARKPEEERPIFFEYLRKKYAPRREFSSIEAQFAEGAQQFRDVFNQLGFRV